MINRARIDIAFYLMVFVVLCDQMSKWWIVHRVMPQPGGVLISSFFNLVLVENRGATFGMLGRFDPRVTFYFLTGTAVLILILLGRWLWRTTSMVVTVALGLIMGGAIGNVVDRLRFGVVIDFLDFHYEAYHWYSFNLADSAIVTGVAILLLDSLIRDEKPLQPPAGTP